MQPPRVLKFLLWIVAGNARHDSFIGDIEEVYSEIRDNKGVFISWIWYSFQVLKAFPVFLLISIYWSITMFLNYIKVAFRNIRRYKTYSLINITGLSLGISACIFIILYIHFELSYDKFFKNSSQICRMTNEIYLGDTYRNIVSTPGPAGPAFMDEIPEILNYTRIVPLRRNDPSVQVLKSSEVFEEKNIFLADSSFFEIFNHTFIIGNSEAALKNPNSIVLTEASAYKLYGDENPVGKTLRINAMRLRELTVTGVLKNLPENTHLKFNYLVSYNSLSENTRNSISYANWGYFPFHTYLLVDSAASLNNIKQKMAVVYEIHSGTVHRKEGMRWVYNIQRVPDIHLHSNLRGELEVNNDITYLYIQLAVGVMIIVIACSNFVNLFIARSSERAKEIGIRKVMGAVKQNIAAQIFGESFLLVFISIISGLLLAVLHLPVFNSLSGLSLSVTYIFQKQVLFFIASLLISTSLLAGIYPSFFLSKFQPVKTIKSNFSSSIERNYFRKSLIIIQFIISISLIFSTAIVLDQLNYMKNKNLGFDDEQIYVIRTKTGQNRSDRNAFIDQLKSNPEIISTSVSTSVPGINTGVNAFIPEGFSETSSFILEMLHVDYDYINTYKLDVIAGRAFSRQIVTDSINTYIINEEAARVLGWTNEEAIGKRMKNITTNRPERQIIGVIRNYHHNSLKEEIKPTILDISPRVRYISCKISSENITETISFINNKWNERWPELEIVSFFVDDNFNNLYRSEEKLSTLFKYFAFLAILISCMGLYALSAYTTEINSREFGIRKILGADSWNLIIQMQKSFLSVLIIASVVALPIVYYIMDEWLQSFAFKTEINPFLYLFSISVVLVLSLVTTAYHMHKIVKSNPADSMRYE